ncbi:MAG: GumC family protein [Hyphomicrobiaceae bacterium]|nr:GumC family protein [Hyphomicrobiaceae bacterium]
MLHQPDNHSSIAQATRLPAADQAETAGLAAAYAKRLVRNALGLFVAGLLGMMVLLALASLLTEQFRASARLLIDPRDLRLMERQVTPDAGSSDTAVPFVESQVQVITASTVLDQAIAALSLDKDPEFNGERPGLVSRLLAPVADWLPQFEVPNTQRQPDPRHVTLQRLEQKLDVRRLDRSFIVEIAVQSDDPDKSQRIVDAVTAAYLKDRSDARSSAATDAGSAIDAGIEDMRARVGAAERQLESYKSANSLVQSSGRLIGEQQLTELNNQLTTARADLERVRARRDAVKAAGRNLASVPEAAASETLRALRGNLSLVAANKARLAAQLKPRHPLMRSLDEQEQAIRQQVEDELTRIKATVEIEFDRAVATEAALSRQIAQLQRTVNTASAAQIRQRELEGELAAARSVYQAALLRVGEAREQARLNTANVRVISPALADLDRTFPPRRAFMAGFGFLLGLSLFALLLWLDELRRSLRPARV